MMPAAKKTAERFVESLLNYKLNVVILSDSNRSEEFNLQFTRLNLGAIINSGEKLHAMVGDLRHVCFDQLGNHPFLQATSIPTRRFAREQVAAQILAHVFSLAESTSYARTRHIDLQRLFKLKSNLDEGERETIERVSELLGRLNIAFGGHSPLRNRAITVSTVLLAWELGLETQQEADDVAFVHRSVRTYAKLAGATRFVHRPRVSLSIGFPAQHHSGFRRKFFGGS